MNLKTKKLSEIHEFWLAKTETLEFGRPPPIMVIEKCFYGIEKVFLWYFYGNWEFPYEKMLLPVAVLGGACLTCMRGRHRYQLLGQRTPPDQKGKPGDEHRLLRQAHFRVITYKNRQKKWDNVPCRFTRFSNHLVFDNRIGAT